MVEHRKIYFPLIAQKVPIKWNPVVTGSIPVSPHKINLEAQEVPIKILLRYTSRLIKQKGEAK